MPAGVWRSAFPRKEESVFAFKYSPRPSSCAASEEGMHIAKGMARQNTFLIESGEL